MINMSSIFDEISHITMQISIWEKKEDVVLHCLIITVEINDDAGILPPKQYDCSKFMEMLTNLQLQFWLRYQK